MQQPRIKGKIASSVSLCSSLGSDGRNRGTQCTYSYRGPLPFSIKPYCSPSFILWSWPELCGTKTSTFTNILWDVYFLGGWVGLSKLDKVWPSLGGPLILPSQQSANLSNPAELWAEGASMVRAGSGQGLRDAYASQGPPGKQSGRGGG